MHARTHAYSDRRRDRSMHVHSYRPRRTYFVVVTYEASQAKEDQKQATVDVIILRLKFLRCRRNGPKPDKIRSKEFRAVSEHLASL